MHTPTDDAPVSSIRDRLKAKKAEAEGMRTTTLPVSGITATYPGFISHKQVMLAQKLAGKDRKVSAVLVSQVCLFEGERLTVDEVSGDLLHNADTVHLMNKVLNAGGAEDEDEGAEGN